MKTVVIRDLEWLRARVREWRRAGEIIGLVPTMGALHQGHVALARAAKAACDRVIVTIFVNPKQFNSSEDLAKYPRTEEADARLLSPLGVDVIFAPNPETVYPHDFSTTVSVSGVSEGLCGAFRPGHFDGVATVVAKLFLMTQADKAFFGEKDYQQLLVIKTMARDLDIATRIFGAATRRDPDGLAMSSRNVYLSAQDRARAPALHLALSEAATRIAQGTAIGAVMEEARAAITAAGFEIDYVEARHAQTLARIADRSEGPIRILAATRLGATRLIDNVAVEA